jgi:glycosyltransferase involved in cell wall biosynthesis
MNVAVLLRRSEPVSLQIYATNMMRELGSIGVEISPFFEGEMMPSGCDILWDPAMCMRRIPHLLRTCGLPVVGTMHGLKAFSLPLQELTTNSVEHDELMRLKEDLDSDWEWFRNRFSAIAAVSAYARRELVNTFALPPEKVYVVHLGINREIFFSDEDNTGLGRPYMLHVSRLDPIKNIDRLLDAYQDLPTERPDLIVVSPPDTDQPRYAEEIGARMMDVPGVRWIREQVPQFELARLYRGALALVSPSLRETFGLPIAEAMACGCPVITSHDTGCAETAARAALLVDPRSVRDIRNAMKRLIDDPSLRCELRSAGIKRSRRFSWQKSAARLRQVFQSVLPEGRKQKPRMRKMEITTIASCSVNCQFCPQNIFKRNYASLNAEKVMTWDTYVTCINKLPAQVGISFGGMSEPFQNPLCTDMVLFAKEKGHIIEIFTTLVGLNVGKIDRLLASLDLGTKASDDRMFVHLPSEENLERIAINDDYLYLLKLLLSSNQYVEFHYHGSKVHNDICRLPFGDRLRRWPLHNRATNETAYYGKRKRSNGKIECVMNLEVNFLLPNGGVLICCQDFAIQHCVGNLLTGEIDDLYTSTEFNSIKNALENDSLDVICRYCDFAVKAISRFRRITN